MQHIEVHFYLGLPWLGPSDPENTCVNVYLAVYNFGLEVKMPKKLIIRCVWFGHLFIYLLPNQSKKMVSLYIGSLRKL